MKNLITLLVLLAIALPSMAQAPQKMSYQAVIRDNNNFLLTNTTVGVQISILEQSAIFPVYVEQHVESTNDNGLVTLQIGDGTVVSGDFASIDWSDGVYSIQTETDPNGGTDYTINGISELLSVPYAFYAENAASEGGNTLDAAYDEGGVGAGRVITTDSGPVEITNAGSNTKGLLINTSVANSFGIDVNQSNSGVAIRGTSTNAANSFAAIQGETNSSGAENSAILGQNSGAGYAVAGQIPANATGGAAVYGSNLRTDGGNGVSGIGVNGVVGTAQSNQGFGVYGVNNNPSGPEALSIGTYGLGFNGVYGQTTDVTNGWAGYFTADLGVDGTGFALGGWVNASDRRLKSNIEPITNALVLLGQLEGTHYAITTKTKLPDGEVKPQTRQQYGVIAQEVEKVFPEMVSEKALFSNTGDDTLYKTVEYDQLIPVLLEAIKELNTKVESLEAEVEELQSK